MNAILVVGSVALDSVAAPSGIAKEVLGGSATYFSIAASFFTKVNLVATIGEDFPERHKKLLLSFGLDLRGLETGKGKTFRWEGSYLKDLNNAETIKTGLNVFADFKPRIPREYKNCPYLFLANIDPDLQLFLMKNRGKKGVVGCDSMNLWINNKKTVLKKIIKNSTFMFLNDAEARLLSGEKNIIKAGKYIVSLGAEYCVIKKGEHGAIVFDKKGPVTASTACLLEEVCDPTGAGDSFAGGFMGHLARSEKINTMTIKNAVTHATVMASFAVENFSVNRFIGLKNKEIAKRLKEYNKICR